MVKHPWPLLEITLSDFRRLATLNINTYLRASEVTNLSNTVENKNLYILMQLNLLFFHFQVQNRFKLPVGTYFYRIHAKPWNS